MGKKFPEPPCALQHLQVKAQILLKQNCNPAALACGGSGDFCAI